MEGGDTAFSYDDSQYTKDGIESIFESPREEANFEEIWKIISVLVRDKTKHLFDYRGSVEFRNFPSSVESKIEHVKSVLSGCKFERYDWVFVLGRNEKIQPVLYAVHVDNKLVSTVYYLDPCLNLASSYNIKKSYSWLLKSTNISCKIIRR